MPRPAQRSPLRGARRTHVEHFVCSVCGYPTLSVRGSRIHHTRSHGRGSLADRNWGIFELVTSDGASIEQAAEAFDVSSSSVRRIILRGLAWPGIFELS